MIFAESASGYLVSLITLLVSVIVSIPCGVLSFVFLHKTFETRKTAILVLSIMFFVIYGMGVIFMLADLYIEGLYFMLAAAPSSIVAFILVLTRPRIVITKKTPRQVVNDNTQYIEEIERLKKLLDSGAISQEDYDKKKSEILNR